MKGYENCILQLIITGYCSALISFTATAQQETEGLIFQKQLAATFAKLMNLNFTAEYPVADPLPSIYK